MAGDCERFLSAGMDPACRNRFCPTGFYEIVGKDSGPGRPGVNQTRPEAGTHISAGRLCRPQAGPWRFPGPFSMPSTPYSSPYRNARGWPAEPFSGRRSG